MKKSISLGLVLGHVDLHGGLRRARAALKVLLHDAPQRLLAAGGEGQQRLTKRLRVKGEREGEVALLSSPNPNPNPNRGSGGGQVEEGLGEDPSKDGRGGGKHGRRHGKQLGKDKGRPHLRNTLSGE